jgi:hypothetical protein
MRAGQNEATGSSGESEVLAEFERLGWAGVIDSRHDVGTDLYLRPRDNRRFELGAVMGAQGHHISAVIHQPRRAQPRDGGSKMPIASISTIG